MKSLSSSAMAYIAPPLVIEVVSTTFYGMEFVPDTFRMGCMNLMLHGVESNPDKASMRYGDTLSPEGQALPQASLILTNPPFGSKKGGGVLERPDFEFPTSHKQL